jgi:ribonuclease HI
MTNNQAEYLALIEGLTALLQELKTAAIPSKQVSLDVRSDSQLVVNQLNGTWKIRNAGLKPLISQAKELLGLFGQRTLCWHSRAESVRLFGH